MWERKTCRSSITKCVIIREYATTKQRERDVFADFEMDFWWKRIKILGGQSAIARILRLPRHSVSIPHTTLSMKNPLKQSTRKKSAGAFPMARENEVTIRSSSRLNGLKKCRKNWKPLNEDLSRRRTHYLIPYYFIRIIVSCGTGGREQTVQNPIWSIKLKIIRITRIMTDRKHIVMIPESIGDYYIIALVGRTLYM